MKNSSKRNIVCFYICSLIALSACQSLPGSGQNSVGITPSATPTIFPTSMPTRPYYDPGELVDYIAQTGDTLPALAAHFNTTETEIRDANPILPARVTTLPAGLPMMIPIYYQALWGSSFQIIPDALFVNGPLQQDFDTISFVNKTNGWLRNHREYAGDRWRIGGELIEYIARQFSISPQLLLAILEYQTHALSDPAGLPDTEYPLGYREMYHKGLNNQLVWAANALNNGYYGWRTGNLRQITRVDGTLEIPDPWQNAATIGLHHYFSQVLDQGDYELAISGQGLAKTFETLFGDPWAQEITLIPGSLEQPAMLLPFPRAHTWAFTGGPHTGWGEGEPFSALDFAPPNVVGGCNETEEFATAVANGVVVRVDPAAAILDLDGDGDERTGWVIYYLHLASTSIAPLGSVLKAGDPIGKPSCEGGDATGTHVHIARKYNGEWIPAEGALAFNLEGWIAKNGSHPYLGTLTRLNKVVTACECSDIDSQIMAGNK